MLLPIRCNFIWIVEVKHIKLNACPFTSFSPPGKSQTQCHLPHHQVRLRPPVRRRDSNLYLHEPYQRWDHLCDRGTWDDCWYHRCEQERTGKLQTNSLILLVGTCLFINSSKRALCLETNAVVCKVDEKDLVSIQFLLPFSFVQQWRSICCPYHSILNRFFSLLFGLMSFL